MGTKNSTIFFDDGNRIHRIKFGKEKYVPSVVNIDSSGIINVGWDAYRHRDRFNEKTYTFSSVKRLVGKPGTQNWGRMRTYPQEIASLILNLMEFESERQTGEDVIDVVLAIPSHYNEHQRRATYETANLVGLNVKRLVNESIAAVISKFHGKGYYGKVFVFDLGGGTLDCSVVDVENNYYETLAIDGSDTVGGDDLDRVVFDRMLEKIKMAKPTFTLEHKQRKLLEEVAEVTKIKLSDTEKAVVRINHFFGPSANLEMEIKRSEFERNATTIFDKMEQVIKNTLVNAMLEASDIDSVLVVGGGCQIPRIQHKLETIFGKGLIIPKNYLELVGIGAARIGAMIAGKSDILLVDRLPKSYGTVIDGRYEAILTKNSIFPIKVTRDLTIKERGTGNPILFVLQGDSNVITENIRLSSVYLEKYGITGNFQLEFEINADSMLSLTLRVPGGDDIRITITSEYGLNAAQSRIIKEKLEEYTHKKLVIPYMQDLLHRTNIIPNPQENQLLQELLEYSDNDFINLKYGHQIHRYEELETIISERMNELKTIKTGLPDFKHKFKLFSLIINKELEEEARQITLKIENGEDDPETLLRITMDWMDRVTQYWVESNKTKIQDFIRQVINLPLSDKSGIAEEPLIQELLLIMHSNSWTFNQFLIKIEKRSRSALEELYFYCTKEIENFDIISKERFALALRAYLKCQEGEFKELLFGKLADSMSFANVPEIKEYFEHMNDYEEEQEVTKLVLYLPVDQLIELLPHLEKGSILGHRKFLNSINRLPSLEGFVQDMQDLVNQSDLIHLLVNLLALPGNKVTDLFLKNLREGDIFMDTNHFLYILSEFGGKQALNFISDLVRSDRSIIWEQEAILNSLLRIPNFKEVMEKVYQILEEQEQNQVLQQLLGQDREKIIYFLLTLEDSRLKNFLIYIHEREENLMKWIFDALISKDRVNRHTIMLFELTAELQDSTLVQKLLRFDMDSNFVRFYNLDNKLEKTLRENFRAWVLDQDNNFSEYIKLVEEKVPLIKKTGQRKKIEEILSREGIE